MQPIGMIWEFLEHPGEQTFSALQFPGLKMCDGLMQCVSGWRGIFSPRRLFLPPPLRSVHPTVLSQLWLCSLY
jgi:hypothetical protein